MNKLLLAVFLAITMLFITPFEGHAGETSSFISVKYKAGYGHGGGHYKAGYGRGYGRGHYGRHRQHYRGHGYRGHGYRGHYYRGHGYRGPQYYWSGSIVIPWYPYGYHAPPPVIIEKQPPVYVQPEKQEENYWYYCPDPQGYYPYIRDCASGWMKVVPDATPPNQ